LQKRLTLPLATAENLRQVLAFEMDRQTPFRAEDVFFAFTIAARDKGSEQITVDLTVLPRQRVSDILGLIAGIGARASALEISTSEGAAIGAANLLPSDDRDDHTPAFGILNWLLLAVAVSLLAALVYLTIDRQRQVLSQLNARADTARQAAQAVPILRNKAAAMAAEAGFLHQRKASSTSTVQLLDELSGLLPDHTWLSLFELKGREVKLTGFSKSSSELLGLIEGSPRFADARFLSPVTRDARRNAEKFSLTANLVAPPDGKE
jgi:general secretion pathway protein L